MARKTKFTKDQHAILSEDLKALCVADGEDFVLEFETTADVANLKSALKSEKDSARTTKAELEKLAEVLGTLKPEDAAKILSDAKTAQEESLKTAGKWDEMKAQMRTEIDEKEIKPLKLEVERYKKAAEKHLIESMFRAAVGKLDPHKGADDVLLPHFMQHVRLVEENGELKAKIFEGDNPRVDAKGDPMTFEDFTDTVYRKSDVFGHLFKPTGAAGSGAPSGNSSGNSGGKAAKTLKRADFDQLAPADRAAHFTGGGVVVD